jgi:hypothetical protein
MNPDNVEEVENIKSGKKWRRKGRNWAGSK